MAPRLGAHGRKDTGQLLEGPSPGGVTLGVWFWSPPGNDSSASGTSRPVLLGWNKMAFLGVAQARPSADVLSPRTVENSKASLPAASPIDIPETLVRQAIAGLTSSSSSHG